MNKNYTILHLHSHFSSGVTNVDSVTRPEQYIAKAKELGMTALAFSEHGNVFHWVAKKQAIEKAGMKYIHACEMYITESIAEKIRDNYHCLLIAKNLDGVKELNRLSSKSFNRDDGHFYYVPRITMDELMNTSDNIIVSTACLGGILNKANDDLASDFLAWIDEHKDRCYLELQPHLDENQIQYNQWLYNWSTQNDIPLVMCTDTHALDKKHVNARVIMQKAKDIHFDGEDKFHLEMPSYDELVDLCRQQNAIPMEAYLEAIENTNKIADMIEPFDLDFSYKYPHLWGDDSESILRDKIEKGLISRHIPVEDYPKYRARIEHEMKAYIHNGAIDFMLLMEDICGWCRDNDIGIGYGRGSCTGSLIAYLLHITEMDAIKFDLNFERFMNVERVSLSDIDTDIPPNRINDVKQYVFNKHGLYCSDIITFNTNALRGSVIDVCRGIYKDNDTIDYREKANRINDLAEQNRAEAEEKYPQIFEYVNLIEGCIVSIGNHPSAMIVAPHSIDDMMGLATTATDDVPISQLNMKEVDLLNYVKLDLLKLDTIQLINDVCKLAGIDRLTPDNLDVADEAVWKSIRDDTVGVFQWESDSAQSYLRQLLSDNTIAKIRAVNPDFSYIDLLSIGNGAIRPAGASYRDRLAAGEYNDNGHPALNELLKSTLGFLVFQCQIINFLHEFCGYTMGEADIVRRHFAKKTGTDKDIPQIHDGFIKTMIADYHMTSEDAEQLIGQFLQVIQDASDYLFSLNHATPYSYEGYACGWLRYYYPFEFLTIALNINVDNEEKTAKLTDYANQMGIKIQAPEFRRARGDYFFDKESNVIYKGIGSIKYMNRQVAEELYELRDMKFSNFFDVLDTIENTSCNSRQLDILIRIGFFAEFGHMNALLYAVELYNAFATMKSIRVESAIKKGYDIDLIRKHAFKITAKTISQIDNRALLMDMMRLGKKIGRIQPTSATDIIRNQLNHLGYTSYHDGSRDASEWLIISMKTNKYGTTFCKLYNICYGAMREYRANKRYLQNNPIQTMQTIKVVLVEKDKMRKNDDGEWVSTGEKLTEMKCWKVVD